MDGWAHATATAAGPGGAVGIGPRSVAYPVINGPLGVFAAGYNANGRCGDGTTTERHVPTAVLTNLTFTAITAGGDQTCGLVVGGFAECWGEESSER